MMSDKEIPDPDSVKDEQKQSTKSKLNAIYKQLTRTKTVSKDVMNTNLRRCLSTFDITLLSFGHMVGSGVYVLTPSVAKTVAGPAIVISYLFSGVASFLAALCYAELGVRYPRSGSAYSYSYLAVGEMWAFIVGWNVALENAIGVAAVARACSAYIDSLAGNAIFNITNVTIGSIHDSDFISTFDFLGLGIVLLFLMCLSFGVSITSGMNNVFSILNMCSIAVIIGVGAYFSDMTNWTNPETGGFMPFGWTGTFTGSASCFFAYVGFDSISAAAEEANDPTTAIPAATIISMLVCSVVYVCVASVLTLMVNYKDISMRSGIPDALSSHGARWAKTVVIIGAICGMCTSIIGNLFAATRVIYAMADDGLLFPLCANVNTKMMIPLGSMYIFGILAAVMALILDVEILAELISIGTLIAYLVVSASVIIIRYKPSSILHSSNKPDSPYLHSRRITQPALNLAKSERSTSDISIDENSSVASEPSSDDEPRYDTPWVEDLTGRMYDRFARVENFLKFNPGRLVNLSVLFFVVFTFLTCIFVRVFYHSLSSGKLWVTFVVSFLTFGLIFFLIIIMMHRQSPVKLGYKVPLVPIFPAISIVVNVWLMANFMTTTYIRLIIWIVIGLAIYFCYGMRHSKLNIKCTSCLPRTYHFSSQQTLPIKSWITPSPDVDTPYLVIPPSHDKTSLHNLESGKRNSQIEQHHSSFSYQ